MASQATNNKGDNRSLGQPRKGVALRSLVISPNLDALLEHEERAREGSRTLSPVYSPLPILTPIEEREAGLPPPPRRTRTWNVILEERGIQKDKEEKEASSPTRATSSTSNPYINPAPALDDILRAIIPPDVEEDKSTDGSTLPWSPSYSDKQQQRSKSIKHENKFADPDPAMYHRRPKSASIFSSDSSTSSHAPPSTAEHDPRVSVSSTLYFASSSHHSHPQSIYNQRDSFMEIYSPTAGEFDSLSISFDPLSPIEFSERSPTNEKDPRPFPLDPETSRSPKPPIPTAPKPHFSSLRSRQSTPRNTPSPAYDNQRTNQLPLPPTTNFLHLGERSELVRKNRKLNRVFGQTPGAGPAAQSDAYNALFSTNVRRRAAYQTRDEMQGSTQHPRPAAFTLNPRRHSIPLSPDDVSFLTIMSPTFERHASPPLTAPPTDQLISSYHNSLDPNRIRSGSPTSFIDLSDDELEKEETLTNTLPTARSISSSHSFLDTMSVVEDERKRKREKLAKLHRFLGSRVPVNLVLGINDTEASLPPPQRTPTSFRSFRSNSSEGDDGPRKIWRRRRSMSSSPAHPDDLVRVKKDLDDKEKAINVRRAHKMEKVFGVAPPQTLYHTRHCAPALMASPPSPPIIAVTAEAAAALSSYTSRLEQASTRRKRRPGTAESSKQLLPKNLGSSSRNFDDYPAALDTTRHSSIYTHYQHSLNSLNDILDRDDRESLAELHEYLNGNDIPTPRKEEFSTNFTGRRLSIASTIKSERRRSLPSTTSMISLAGSEFTISTPMADVTSFQMRRRRAAKLTQFFGVNYRELVNDILESIENGLEHEQKRGTLRAEEVEDLLSNLRKLKLKRKGLY